MDIQQKRARAEEIAREIGSLERSIRDLRSEAMPLLEALAEFDAPFKVGDVVSRSRGGERIERVKIKGFKANGHVAGVRIRKDGTAGAEVDIWPYALKLYSVEAPNG